MDFVVGLPKTLEKFDSIGVIVDRLTKSTHFIPVKITYDAKKLAKIYIREVARLHGVPISIVSDRGTMFTSRFWECLHEELGTKLDLSTTFHPQTNRQSEPTIQVLEDMLRACVIDFGGHWDQSPIGWFDVFEVRPWGTDLLRKSLEKVKVIQAKLLAAQSRQKEYADRKGKLSSRYIGPFEILKRVGEVAYKLALPLGLSGVHPVFYVSMLKRYHRDGSYIIQWDSILLDENWTYEEEPVAILDRDVRKLRSKEISSIKDQWKNHPVEEGTWKQNLICLASILSFSSSQSSPQGPRVKFQAKERILLRGYGGYHLVII
ncbi:uncharacterized protein LOC132061223 [Lycium ferocissimum]|uniref:uncharacterized protein LOC132061223 n=1 Tax=Lycium ferocissimum TaxID=112874 RepID=UPI002815BD36|nr:uncharacterized protein LOC132061223 [Lycium ferocissimum]